MQLEKSPSPSPFPARRSQINFDVPANMENTQASTAITSSPLGKLQKSRLRKWRDESTRMAALRMLRDGSPMSAIRRTLKVSKSCVYRWYRQWEQERTLSCKKPPGPARKFTDAVAELVVEHLAQHPSSTARQLIAATGAPVKENAIYRNLRRLGITHKKAGNHRHRAQGEARLHGRVVQSPQRRPYARVGTSRPQSPSPPRAPGPALHVRNRNPA
ncbi:hypothetical protein DFJ74DRAFT_669128 [Hyaloraphidium curvatum]|nr:hypothetical protein DFJ74DRAFT_669128 [Hyaloraphidium curvatum]